MKTIRALIAAINRLAAAIEASNNPVQITYSHPGQPQSTLHPAQLLPVPRGGRCALGCYGVKGLTHGISMHDEAGCIVEGCDCSAPFGRIMPQSDVPDDASSITDTTP